MIPSDFHMKTKICDASCGVCTVDTACNTSAFSVNSRLCLYVDIYMYMYYLTLFSLALMSMKLAYD